jgi:hypothetical protein
MVSRSLMRWVAPALAAAALVGAASQHLPSLAINPQPLPPGGEAINPQPLPPHES